jgi:thiopurine S-methyltransferase
MNENFWLTKWKDGDIRFHQSKYHPQLEKFGDRFSEGTILVPLCGKTLDMLYLSAHGHMVVGVELSPIACEDFFIENGIHFSKSHVNDFVVYDSDNIQLWCGDFFKLPQHVWDKVTGIYDRAALVALPIEVRQKYAREVVTRTENAKHLEILLVSFEYPDGAAKGPPFSVPEQEVHEIYRPFKIELIHTEKEEKYTKDHPTLKSIELKETVYWVTKN